MAKFKVGWTYEEGGYCIVEAADADEARDIVFQHLDDEGNASFEDLGPDASWDIVHRDYNTLEVSDA